MNAATRGVILAVIGVALGVFILGRGFDAAPDLVSIGAADPPDETIAPTEPEDEDEDEADSTPAEDAETPTEEVVEDPVADETTTETPTVEETTDPAAAPVLHTSSEVRLLVVNGTDVSGAAGTVNNSFIAMGYNGLTPTNSNSADVIAETAVYYAEGYILDARAIAQALNAPATAVTELPQDVPVDDIAEANVVIILGSDLVPAG